MAPRVARWCLAQNMSGSCPSPCARSADHATLRPAISDTLPWGEGVDMRINVVTG